MKKLWSSGGVLLVIALSFFAFIGYQWYQRVNPPKLPEVVAVGEAFDKMVAAVEVGINLAEYNRMVIDAKVLANAAERKLPTVTDPRVLRDDLISDPSPDQKLQRINLDMQTALGAYVDAHTVWQIKASGKTLGDTDNGRAIRWKYKFEATMSEDDVQQALWYKARRSSCNFQMSIGNFDRKYCL